MVDYRVYGCNSGIDMVAWLLFSGLLMIASFVAGTTIGAFVQRHR